MFNAALHGRGAPRHLSTDPDPLFEAHRWRANLRTLEIDEIQTVPHVPLSHPFVERLILTIRREVLDHVLSWNARDPERKLVDFQAYDNGARGHASLAGRWPASADTQSPGPISTMYVGSPTAETWSSSRWRPDDEFETHRDGNAEPAVGYIPNGPYVVRGGGAALEDVEQGEGASSERLALCRCGQSTNKPFCSGAHWYQQFDEHAQKRG